MLESEKQNFLTDEESYLSWWVFNLAITFYNHPLEQNLLGKDCIEAFSIFQTSTSKSPSIL